MKLKILGAALLALVATSAFAVTNASSEPSGHFVHHGPQTTAWVTGHEGKGTSHQLKFYRLLPNSHTRDPERKPIECETATYVGKAEAQTVTSLEVTPTYFGCSTEGGVKNEVTVAVNGCSYVFSSQGTRQHGTVEVKCPVGQFIKITHTNPHCTITITPQKLSVGGISYTQAESELTANVTVQTIAGHFHNGLCAFLGTNQKFEMSGSVTVKGFEDKGGTHKAPLEGAQISITST